MNVPLRNVASCFAKNVMYETENFEAEDLNATDAPMLLNCSTGVFNDVNILVMHVDRRRWFQRNTRDKTIVENVRFRFKFTRNI